MSQHVPEIWALLWQNQEILEIISHCLIYIHLPRVSKVFTSFYSQVHLTKNFVRIDRCLFNIMSRWPNFLFLCFSGDKEGLLSSGAKSLVSENYFVFHFDQNLSELNH